MMHDYYILVDARGFHEVRQNRYRHLKEEHPNDVCGVAWSLEEIKRMLVESYWGVVELPDGTIWDPARGNKAWYKIMKDGEVKYTFECEPKDVWETAVRWIHNHHSYSADHGLRHEGYGVVNEANEKVYGSYSAPNRRIHRGEQS